MSETDSQKSSNEHLNMPSGANDDCLLSIAKDSAFVNIVIHNENGVCDPKKGSSVIPNDDFQTLRTPNLALITPSGLDIEPLSPLEITVGPLEDVLENADLQAIEQMLNQMPAQPKGELREWV